MNYWDGRGHDDMAHIKKMLKEIQDALKPKKQIVAELENMSIAPNLDELLEDGWRVKHMMGVNEGKTLIVLEK